MFLRSVWFHHLHYFIFISHFIILDNMSFTLLIFEEEKLNWTDININEYMVWLGLWMLMSVFPVGHRRFFYWRTTWERTQPLAPFAFQHWMSLSRFEQTLSHHTLMCEVNYMYLQRFKRVYINCFSNHLLDDISTWKQRVDLRKFGLFSFYSLAYTGTVVEIFS